MTDTIRAVHCKHFKPEVVQVPRPKGEGVRVKVVSSGICGSDLHMLSYSEDRSTTLGHENSGTLSDGKPVAIEPLAACGHCDYCKVGHYNHCELGMGMLFGIGRDGGMADEILVPERCLVSLPSGLPARDACLVEPMAVSLHGLRLASNSNIKNAAVIGGGTIGLCAVAAAVSENLNTTLFARHDSQRRAGEILGATLGTTLGTTLDSTLDTTPNKKGLYDLVIDAAGTTSSLEQAVSLCKPKATLLLVATYWDGMVLPGMEVCMKEIQIIPAAMYSQHGKLRDVDWAAKVLAENPLIPEVMITHRFPLEAAVEAFETAANRASGAIKVVLEP